MVKIDNLDVPLSLTRGEPLTILGSIEYEGDYRDVSIFYFLKDRDGDVVIKGNTTPDANDNFSIELSSIDTARLSEGSNELRVMAISSKALMPDIRSTALLAIGNAIEVKDLIIDGNRYGIGVSVGSVSSIDANKDENAIILRLSDLKSDKIRVVLDREVIDAKEGDDDIPFVVLVDNTRVDAIEEARDGERVLEIPLSADSKEVKIIGSRIVPAFGQSLV